MHLLYEFARRYTQPSLSPDGSRVAVAIQGANDHVWLLDLARGTLTRQSFDNENLIPVWRPDGRAVAIGFHAVGRPPTLHLLFMDGSGRRERLLESELTQSLTSWFTQFPTSWSLDGNRLAYIERSLETGRDIWIWIGDALRGDTRHVLTRWRMVGLRFRRDGTL